LPVIRSYRKVDVRTKAVDVPNQEAITKDNVSISINAVIYYKVFDAAKVILEVENYYFAVSQLAQTTNEKCSWWSNAWWSSFWKK